MQKLALLLGAAMLLSVSAIALPDPTLETPDARHELPGGWEIGTCGGTAPAQTHCSSGMHTRTGPGWFGSGNGAGCTPFDPSDPVNTCDFRLPGYVGVVRASVIYKPYVYGPLIVPSVTPEQRRSLDVYFDGSDPEGNPIYIGLARGSADLPQLLTPAGAIPLPLTFYEHTCTSFDYVEPPNDPTTQGGSGAWSCFTYHNVLLS